MSMLVNPFLFGGGGGNGDAIGLIERFFWPRHATDPAIAQLNPATLLTKGLAFCAYSGGARQQELVGQQPVTIVAAGNYFLPISPGLYGYAKGGTTNVAYWPWNEMIGTITTQSTMLIWCALGTLVSFGHLLSIPYRDDGTWAAPFVSMNLQRNSTTSAMSFGYANAGSLVSVVSDTGILLGDSTLRMLVATRDGATVTFYSEGVPFGAQKTLASNAAVDFNTRNKPAIGNRGSTSSGESQPGTFVMAAIWNRCLTPGEVFQLWSRPLLLLKPKFGV